MRSPRSHPILWVSLLMALVAAVLGVGPAVAQSELDVRGTWQTVVVYGTRFPATLIISDMDAAGHVRGHWSIHGEGASGRMVGTISGSKMVLRTTEANADYRYTGTVRIRNGRLVWSGRWVGPVPTWKGTFTATLGEPLIVASPQGGERPSAALVVCNRDMTVSSDGAVLSCTAQVTDASAQPGSTAPTGEVTWTAEAGALTTTTCSLGTGSGSTASCAVSLRAGAGEIPIGSAPPVTASYAGDAVFAPSDGTPQLGGGGGEYTESDLAGPGCNPASVPQPTVDCGDPVDPATGGLVLRAVDLAVGGRGPGLAVDRSYDSVAAAAGEVGRFGAGWSDAYGARIETGPKKAVTVHLGTGATVPFTAAGKRFTAPGWVTATLVRGPAKGFTLTTRDGTTLVFDREGRLATVADRTQEPVSLTYAADGSLAAATDASGRSLTFTTDGGRVIAATDPTGRTVRYAYDGSGRLVSVTDVTGGTTTYAYDDAGRVTSITDATGATTTNRYDPDGRVTEQTDPAGATVSFSYLGAFPDLLTIATDGEGVRSAFEHQGGVLVAATRGLDGAMPSVTHHVYDDRLRLVLTIDPDGSSWRFGRDEAGDVISITDPRGGVATATYDEAGNVTGTVSAAGIATRLDRDARGLLLRVIDGAGSPQEAVTVIGREDPQHPADVTSITDPSGATTTFRYDAHGELIGRTDPLGGTTVATRDGLGWLEATTDQMGAMTTFTRDAAGRPIAVVDALGASTTLVRDALGRPLAATDALDQTTTVDRDATGRARAVTLPDGAELGTSYDAIGAIVGQLDATGATWTIERDDHGRITGWVDPLGDRWSATYDAADHLTSTTDPTGATTRYAWSAGLLMGVDHADGTPDVSYAYDADGRRTSMTDGTGTTSYTRDALGRITSVTDGSGATVGTTFDAAGRLTAISYPGGHSVERTFDAVGRLVSVRDWLGNTSTFTWDAAGRLVRMVAGDGSVTERTHDARGGILAITVTAPGATQPMLVFGYERDALGRVTAVQETLGPDAATRRAEATRDPQGRLTGLGDDTVAFDPAGNLTSLRGASLSVDAAGRLLTSDGPDGQVTFTNDAAGRRTGTGSAAGGGTMTYDWDAAGNLVAAGAATFTFDGDGTRTSATWGDGTRSTFTWLRATEAPELLGDGASWYVRGPDGMPLEEVRADGTVRWLHLDQAGSVRAMTDATGSLVGITTWDVAGLPVSVTGETSRLGYQGHYTDPGTGLQQLGARPYDPVTGRFLAVDPLVMATRAPYAFASGDPLTFGDPAGTDSTLLMGLGDVPTSTMLTDLGLPPAAMTCAADAAPSSMLTDLKGQFDQAAGKGRVRQALERAGLRFDVEPMPVELMILQLGITVTVEESRLREDLLPTVLQSLDDILSGRVPGGGRFGF